MQFNHACRTVLAALPFMATLIFLPVARAQSDTLIVPGASLGPVHLGMSDAQVYNILGDPKSTQDVAGANGACSQNIYEYPTLEVHVCKNTHEVFSVSSGDSRYATADGIRVGSSGLAVSLKLGAPPNLNGYRVYKGIVLSFDGGGNVIEIGILNN